MKVISTAAYIRVSHQEQVLHGISLDAQRHKLKEYAEQNNLQIVGWYEDEGVSGRKLIKNRPALQRMIQDAEEGKFEHIIFIKLDRFFRSVAEYHECMKRLGNVTWDATEEKYDLTTASGRLLVNSKLMVAEYEADTTGERIRLTNEYKVKAGQPLSGSMPLGFKIVQTDNGKKVVHDEEKGEILLELIAHFKKYQSKRRTVTYYADKYGVNMEIKSFNKLMRNTMLYGSYRGNDEYCEPYISKEEFDELQTLLPRSYKNNTPRVYLFSGLFKCPVCGGSMNGSAATFSGKRAEYLFYRCHKRYRNHLGCTNRSNIAEHIIEAKLLEQLEPLAIAEKKRYKAQLREAKKINTQPLKDELERLNYMFQKNRIGVDEYDRRYEDITSRLEALQKASELPVTRDLSHIDELINSDWKTLYNALDREHKRMFWNRVLASFSHNESREPDHIFFK